MSWEDIKKMAAEESLPLHTVAAEIIQIAFLEGLYSQKESENIIFHGGTAIRLLHGGYRYSEDLDFTGNQSSYEQIRKAVEKSLSTTKNLLMLSMGPVHIELTARPPKQKRIFAWWLRVSPPGYHGKIHVKLEFGQYPAYQPNPLPVTRRQPFLEVQPLILSISIEELYLDKINALAGRSYMKERDLLDMWYLTKIFNPQIDFDLLIKKFEDYRTEKPVQTLKKRLAEMDPKALAISMEKFLPEKYRHTFQTNQYREVIETNQKLIHTLLEKLDK